MSLANLFSGNNFEHTVRKYCHDQGWSLSKINRDIAVLKFHMSSGRKQVLYIVRYETTLEFSVPSLLQYEADDAIPHYLSTLLLERNSKNKIGFWCIEMINGKYIFSYMHNAELSLIDSAYFGRVVRTLINEVDDFEGSILELI